MSLMAQAGDRNTKQTWLQLMAYTECKSSSVYRMQRTDHYEIQAEMQSSMFTHQMKVAELAQLRESGHQISGQTD